MARALPPNASVVQPQEGAKLHAPAAARNTDALVALLCEHAPATGTALEIASGTGQHVTAFATALPDLRWHPTDVDTSRIASIDAHIAEAGLTNVAGAENLNATNPGWSDKHANKDLILLINLLHLVSTPEARTLIAEAAQALATKGKLILYGPFKRAGALTSSGDARFDADLRGANPLIGYKDDLDIKAWLGNAGLTDIDTQEMPANNLAFIAGKPPT